MTVIIGILPYILSICYGVYSVMRNDILGMSIALGMLFMISVCLGIYL